jgi:hypothetical protein
MVLRVKEIYLLFSVCELWNSAQCTTEAEHDGGFFTAFLSIYQDDHFKRSTLETSVSVEMFYHITRGVCARVRQSKRRTANGTSVILFSLV